MKKGVRFLAALMLTASMLLHLHLPEVSALKCARSTPPAEEMASSALTFKGTFISETSEQLTFQVSTWWKGESAKTIVKLYSNMWTHFEPGVEYIVFASKQDGKLSPRLCGNTAPSANFDLNALGPGIPAGMPGKEPMIERLPFPLDHIVDTVIRAADLTGTCLFRRLSYS